MEFKTATRPMIININDNAIAARQPNARNRSIHDFFVLLMAGAANRFNPFA